MDRRTLITWVAALTVVACGSTPATSTAPASTVAGAARSPAGVAATVMPSPSASAAAVASEAPIEIPMTGSFVFHRHDDATIPHVWVSCPDLSHARQLPSPPGFSAGWAVWSPDGQRIAFNAGDDDPDIDDRLEAWDIYTMDRDGGDVTKLTDATALLGDPAYSPDGTLIAFDSTEPGKEGIWVMDADDGRHQRRVVARPGGPLQDYAPRFSPDGKELVFTREVEAETDAALWIVGLDGTNLRRLTPPDIYPNKAAWSPDGTRIVFAATEPGETLARIWTIAPDGTGLTNLNAPPFDLGANHGYSAPVWSPDGSQILLGHGVHPGPSRLGLAVMRADGSGLRWVADGGGFEHLPDWTAAPC